MTPDTFPFWKYPTGVRGCETPGARPKEPPLTFALYAFAALFEITGCFAVWHWWRQGASALWLIPGALALAGFAFLLALTPPSHAGRSFAAYGGVYIAASLLWLWLVEGTRPGLSDLSGAALALLGAGVILWGARG
ncbi:YnfA family protein [Tabrizicola sp. KVB23]|uniref:YnfA family protein n=1 Tax=Fuscibacter oryzae TaxID=2803939 RepID=A0A8J7SU60_9RHOB|nr:YnfA family protein [Fuscibacter oryzae]